MITFSKYIVRFDDICPTMNWAVWAEIESCLRAYEIRPIVAIVPNNKDKKLIVDRPRRDFWKRVREWQSMGWSIGFHGYEHRCDSADGGILGINAKSEFAKVPYEKQLDKLKLALQIFKSEGVKPDVWVAPWHSFDTNTLCALRKIGINCVSDGFGCRVTRDKDGMHWVPQQLWRFRCMPFGVWTVATHHSLWTRQQLDGFLHSLIKYAKLIRSLTSALQGPIAAHQVLDEIWEAIFWKCFISRRFFTGNNLLSQRGAELSRFLE